MSYSTWKFYHPFPLLWMVVLEHGAAEICVHVTGNVWKKYDCWWLLMIVEQWFRNLYTIGASSLQYFYTTSTVPTSLRQLYRPHTHAGDIFSTTTPYCRPVTAAHELVTQSCLRYSSTVLGCPPLRFLVSSSRSRSNRDVHLLRPGRVRAIDVRCSSSAVQPRHISPSTWATSFTEQFQYSHLLVRALQS